MSCRSATTLVWTGCAENTPLGPVWVANTPGGLAAVEIGARESEFAWRVAGWLGAAVQFEPARTVEAVEQMRAYLHGERRAFTLPIDWSLLRPFQERALRVASRIPYGCVATYGDIARQIGAPRGARAVGRAMATNPMPLVLPCHRVIGADGGLHGYGAPGGLETKAWLLALERANSRHDYP